MTTDKKKPKILIVEDEESNYELLRAILRKMDLELFWAQTGIQALEYCRKHSFGLIFMDIKMPEMNGYDAILKLREMGVNCPIIAQTAYARIEDEERALSLGFNAYISKPIDRGRLMSFIEKYL
ncbi:MAG: response regulator [Bacteroidales bacterium]|nr:response regulator [Bacteroidales bacterium]